MVYDFSRIVCLVNLKFKCKIATRHYYFYPPELFLRVSNKRKLPAIFMKIINPEKFYYLAKRFGNLVSSKIILIVNIC